MPKNAAEKLKNLFKSIEKKSEEKKMRMMWVFVIFFMVGVFLLWIMTVSRNFSDAAKFKMNFSGLPELPQTENMDIEKTLKDGQDALEKYASQSNEQLDKTGRKYIEDNKILADDNFSTLKISDVRQDKDTAILQYQHYFKEVPVLGSGIVLAVNMENGQVLETQDSLKKGIDIAVDPAIAAKDAQQIAAKEINNANYEFKNASLAICENEGKYYLAWKTVFESENGGDNKEVLVGAKHGGIIKDENTAAPANNQTSDMTR